MCPAQWPFPYNPAMGSTCETIPIHSCLQLFSRVSLVSSASTKQGRSSSVKTLRLDLSSLQVQLFVEQFTTEVQPNAFKVLKAESKEEVASGKEALTHGLKVLDGFLKNHALEGGDYLLGKDFSCELPLDRSMGACSNSIVSALLRQEHHCVEISIIGTRSILAAVMLQQAMLQFACSVTT